MTLREQWDPSPSPLLSYVSHHQCAGFVLQGAPAMKSPPLERDLKEFAQSNMGSKIVKQN